MRTLIVGLLLLFLVGCATGHRDLWPEYHQTKPHSILVVPVVNNSVDVLASESVLSTLPNLLFNRGYYLFPVNTVRSLLEMEGFYEPVEIHQLPTPQLAELFGADVVLYVTVHQWTAKYVVLQTTTVVDFEYEIRRGSDGESLWHSRQSMSYSSNPSGSRSIMTNLVSAAISAAMERAAPNYIPLTRQANQKAFVQDARHLPLGPYHPSYEQYYQRFSN